MVAVLGFGLDYFVELLLPHTVVASLHCPDAFPKGGGRVTVKPTPQMHTGDRHKGDMFVQERFIQESKIVNVLSDLATIK